MDSGDPSGAIASSKPKAPSHHADIGRSPVTSTTTQPRLAQMRTSAVQRTEPLPDALGHMCVSAKGKVINTAGASPADQSSSRLSLAHMRPATPGHCALLSAQSPTFEQSKSGAIPVERELDAHQQQQQQRKGQEEKEEHAQSPLRLNSLLDFTTSISIASSAAAQQHERQQQPVGWSSPTSASFCRRSLKSARESPIQPLLQLSSRRVSSGGTSSKVSQANQRCSPPNGAAVSAAAVAVAAAEAPASPTTAVVKDAPADTSGLDVEYLGAGSNFDIDSSDEDDGGGRGGEGSVEHLHIDLSSIVPGGASGTAEQTAAAAAATEKPMESSMTCASPPPVNAHSTTLPPQSSTAGMSTRHGGGGGGGGGGLCLQPAVESASLVSLAEAPDVVLTPSSPHSSANDRLDSTSPVFNGLASGTGSRPSSSCFVGASYKGRVDQASNNGLATFCNQPRECANCKNPAVAFVCEVCEDFFLCEDCRFNLAVVYAIHDPTHAMLSLQDNHCGSSRSLGGGDSIFSLSGESGASSLFNPPCSRCGRVIDDTEPLYRCEQCDYVLCQECFFKQPEEAVADSNASHEHVLKRFQRKSKTSSILEGAVVNKSRNSGGNRVINDYAVVRLLGRGSYAKVKLVQHIRTRELFALKILKRQRKSSISGLNLGRSRVKLANAGVTEDDLLREIAVMKFIDHPNITKLKEVIEDVEAQKVYVIMEYCENGPVHVLGNPPLVLEQVRQYGADILRGLLYLHAEFLYHRDIKPANCLVNYAYVAKIADFGTCNSQIRSKSSEGTLAFSCPEQFRGEEVSGDVVDSWAFALTLYEMAYGTLPVPTTSLIQHRNVLLGPEPLFIPQTGDPQLRDLLTAMLDKDLKHRMLLAAAARHPFFEPLHIDPHGALSCATQLASPRHQQAQQQPEALTELYDKALKSVYRGKNLKDCFHGVRALRRIRRKEAEMARRGGGADGGSNNSGDDACRDQENDAAYFFDDDDELSGILPSRDTDLDFSRQGPNVYSYGSSIEDAEDGEERPAMNHSSENRDEEEAARAASVVEEIVQHHLASKDSKVEVTYVSLSRQSTLEKLNALAATAAELRLSHNALVSLTGLHFSAFSMLKEISITFNRLDAFPEEVFLAPRLVRLDLSHNRISTIPPSLVSHAPFLERLNLHHNYITYVGTVSCPSLTPPPLSPVLSSPPPLPHPPTSNVNVKSAWQSPTGSPRGIHTRQVSVLAAPCLRHVRLSGNPLETLPLALETTTRLELVLDAIPALMEQWQAYTQMVTTTTTTTVNKNNNNNNDIRNDKVNNVGIGANVRPSLEPALLTTHSGHARACSAPSAVAKTCLAAATNNNNSNNNNAAATTPASLLVKRKLPAVIVWDDSFPVRIPDVEPAVWLAVNNMAVYRVQTLRACRTRRVVLCQCADPRFPNGVFDSGDLEAYFSELARVLQEQRQERQQQQQPNTSFDGLGTDNEIVNGALPPIVGRAARSYVESYFFVTDDESNEDGGYHNLVEYLNDALAAKEPVLVVVVTSGNTSAVRTTIVAALSTCLTQLRGKDPEDVSEQAELVVSTMRSLYA